MAFTPSDDNRKFTELYSVQRLQSSHVPTDAQVCICTIQRMYSILQGRELSEGEEETNPAEPSSLLPSSFKLRTSPLPVAYNEKVPIEHFDFIVIDECHRSIYNLWRQVLEYFEAFLIGLTATPDNRTFAFFKQNVVSEYTHEQVVMGSYDADTVSSLAGRLARIERQLSPEQKATIAEKAGGTSLQTIIKDLFTAIDGDVIEKKALELTGQEEGTEPGTFAREQAQQQLVAAADKPLTGATVNLIIETCTANLQTIDNDTLDVLLRAEWDADARENADAMAADFAAFLEEHRDQLTALTIYYQQPQRRQEVTLAQIKEVLQAIQTHAPKPAIARSFHETLLAHFPNSLVNIPEEDTLTLKLTNDPKDRHVLAAAIHAKAAILLTYNLKDFPGNSLKPWEISAIHPQDFLLDLYHTRPKIIVQAIVEMAEERSRSLTGQLLHFRNFVPAFSDQLLQDLGTGS